MKLSDYDWSRKSAMEAVAHEVVFIRCVQLEMRAMAEPSDAEQIPDVAYVRADKLREAYELLKQWTDEFGPRGSDGPLFESHATLREAGFIKPDPAAAI